MNRDALENIPKEPGVYLMKNRSGEILYIGKAKELKKRVKDYFTPGRDGRVMVPFLTMQVENIETIVTFSEKEALLLENTLIKKHQPKYNVLLKDDKTFISLTINHKHQWPMVRITRYRGKPKEGALHFGPYTSAFAARQTLDLISRVFKLRQCSDRELTSRERPCLLYSIKRCLGPCANKCTKKEYEKELKRTLDFLKGQDKEVVKGLEEEMKKASENLEFEKAGALLKTIEQIKHVIESKQSIIRSKGKDCDIFALYHEGKYHIISQLMYRGGRLTGADNFKFIELASTDEEIFETFLLQHYQQETSRPPEVLLPIKLQNQETLEELLNVKIIHPKIGDKQKLIQLALKNAKSHLTHAQSKEELLLDLQETCNLDRCPVHIECFDTSNISGDDLVACMVGFVDGIRDKEKTRLFKIQNVEGPDDYGAMYEVLTRHYKKAKANDILPDLAVIDGGKGQLGVAERVVNELGLADEIPVAALAKRFEEVYVPGSSAPVRIQRGSEALFMLQRIRDEAHRFANSFHRERRSKRMTTSSLDGIPGLGPARRDRLVKAMGGVKAVKAADLESLQALSFLPDAVAQAIFDKFHSESA